jgi:CRP-like cAMP-binding protein
MPVLETPIDRSTVPATHRTRPGHSAGGRVIATADTLAGINAFHGLSKDQRQTLVPLCHCRNYEAGQAIVTYHDDTRDVYFIISGQVQATIFSVTGKQVALGDIGPGAMFGELSAIDGEPRSAHVVASTDAMVCSMSPDDFWYVLQTYPIVAKATLRRLTWMVRYLCSRVFEISTLPVKHRIHAELLRLALQHMTGENKAVIIPAPTQTDIANHIGTHREGVTREMTRLKTSGLIERRNNRLFINDVMQLRAMVQQVTGLAGSE